MPVVKYDNVDIHIDSKVILEDVTFTLDAGEFAYIVGSVGSSAGGVTIGVVTFSSVVSFVASASSKSLSQSLHL